MEAEDEIERILVAIIEGCVRSGPSALARTVLESLWEAGYEVTLRPDPDWAEHLMNLRAP